MQTTLKTIKELKRKKESAPGLMEMIEYKQASLKGGIGPTYYRHGSHFLKISLNPSQ
tara:strand:+ start:191 stop:361 length:171 start_codon:yes stop_codon:yes gene_type:complete